MRGIGRHCPPGNAARDQVADRFDYPRVAVAGVRPDVQTRGLRRTADQAGGDHGGEHRQDDRDDPARQPRRLLHADIVHRCQRHDCDCDCDRVRLAGPRVGARPVTGVYTEILWFDTETIAAITDLRAGKPPVI